MTLVANEIVLRHGNRRVLDGVNVHVQPGELVLLAGRNGAGKSTLLRILLGAMSPDAGSVALRDRPLAAWPARERARHVAFVPQQPDCPFDFRGRDVVAMGRHPHTPSAADADAVAAALRSVDAESFAERPVTTLSGGELRRIAVARALATEANLLLLDEPLSNLDLEHALGLATLLRHLADVGKGLLVATHDFNLLAPHAHRVVLLHEGRVHADGAPEAVLTTANFAQVFGVAAAAPSGYFPRAFTAL
jgi:iron complex transport system ATP-binding protein